MSAQFDVLFIKSNGGNPKTDPFIFKYSIDFMNAITQLESDEWGNQVAKHDPIYKSERKTIFI